MKPEQQIAADAMRGAWSEKEVERMLRAVDGRLEAAVLRFLDECDYDAFAPTETQATNQAARSRYTAAYEELRRCAYPFAFTQIPAPHKTR